MAYLEKHYVSNRDLFVMLQATLASRKTCALCKKLVDSVQITPIQTVGISNGGSHFLVEIRCHGQNRIDKIPLLNLITNDGRINNDFVASLISAEVFEPQIGVGELQALQLRIAEIKAEFERSQARETRNVEIKRRIKLDPAAVPAETPAAD